MYFKSEECPLVIPTKTVCLDPVTTDRGCCHQWEKLSGELRIEVRIKMGVSSRLSILWLTFFGKLAENRQALKKVSLKQPFSLGHSLI